MLTTLHTAKYAARHDTFQTPRKPAYTGNVVQLFHGSRKQSSLAALFMDYIEEDSFPCVGAKAALARGEIQVHEYGLLNHPANDEPLLDALVDFVDMLDSCAGDDSRVHSFVAVFNGPRDTNELDFENLLWTQLYNLHVLDVDRGAPAASDISSDTDSPQFSLSLAGHPFFVIGLHPGSSRMARRFQSPVLVFNSHQQFEKLRENGRYEKMQAATRKRDIALQGSINPNLSDFGTNSEARQYSGRKTAVDWKCPFNFDTARKP
ncbi:MAG TPA: guanitoxin biosynthesis heme-dependent pre-guanitoxin N-hydroxylase GntA [Limnobacter sp.]|nr:guanitoxin biosynthesis heme-dependent pre-guanitoxin N-hydroxylase GntA [Limnobacter sp.]